MTDTDAIEHPRILDRRIFNASQSWCLTGMYDLRGERLRVSIRRNAYDNQSHARVEVMDPGARKWNFLASVPYPEMASLACSYVQDEDRAEPVLAEDEAELLRLAALALGMTS